MQLKQIALYIICIVGMIACQSKTKQSTTDHSPELVIGVMSSMDYLPIAVAQQAGYFDEEGIDVDIQKFFSANDRDAALQSGSLGATIIDYTGAAIQRAGGVDVVCTSQCDGTFELMVSPNSHIHSLADLKQKHASTSRNTVIDYCMDVLLDSVGISREEINLSEMNKIPLRLEMLRNNKIEATILPDPFVTIAEADGMLSVADMNSMDVKVTGIIFTQSAIDTKTDAITSFYKAYNRAIADLQTHDATYFSDILIKEIGFPAELIDKVKLPAYQQASCPRDKDLHRVEQWLKAKNLVPSAFDITEMVSTKFCSAQ